MRTGSSAIGRMAVGIPERVLERADRGRQRPALADPCGPRDVCREVAIAEPEPGLLAVFGQAVHDGPRLAGEAPTPVVIESVGEHVEDRVVVGHDEQTVALGVVAGVRDDRQVAGGEDRLEAVGQLRAAGPAGQGHDPHAVTRRGVRRPVACGRWSRGRTARASAR